MLMFKFLLKMAQSSGMPFDNNFYIAEVFKKQLLIAR
jgi:hypothetical protein